MTAARSPVGRGLIAGALAAAAVALWFLLIDAAAGRPLHTPAFLASALAGAPTLDGDGLSTMGLPGVALYTVLHFLVFLALGVAVSWVFERLETMPGVLLGAVLGFLLFDLVFYGSIWVTGVDVVRAIGWPEVLAGNIIAGIVLTSTLRALDGREKVTWREVLAGHRIIREGLVAGLIGAGVVALWFLVLDAFMGRLLFTPAALGSAFLEGARSVAEVDVGVVTVLGYSVVHLSAFLVTGWVAAAVLSEAEDVSAAILLGGVMLFVTFEAFFMGIIAIVAQWLFAAIPWWSILVANVLAAFSMGWYLIGQHPKLARQLDGHPLEEDLVYEDRVAAGPPAGAAGTAGVSPPASGL